MWNIVVANLIAHGPKRLDPKEVFFLFSGVPTPSWESRRLGIFFHRSCSMAPHTCFWKIVTVNEQLNTHCKRHQGCNISWPSLHFHDNTINTTTPPLMFWHLDPLESIISISGRHCCLKWACDMWKGWICLLSKMEVKTLISVITKTTNFFGVWSANSFVGEHKSQGIFQQILLMIAVVMMAPLTKGEIRWNLWLAMSWVGGREQVGALRSWQPALQSSSITTILRQMHLRSSLLELSPGDIWDQRGNLGRSGVASSAAPLLPDQKGGKFIWVTSNQQCHSTHIKSSHQPWNWVLRSLLGKNVICLQDWGSFILGRRFLNPDSIMCLLTFELLEFLILKFRTEDPETSERRTVYPSLG